MKKEKIKITAVSYLNTIPFVYGIKHHHLNIDIELDLQVPSLCADYFNEGKADIALVPVGALPDLNNYKILNRFCIGAIKEVCSVFILSNCSIKEITSLKLDRESYSSNKLAQILLKEKKVDYVIQEVNEDAKVMIGDKAIEERKNYPYVYDLASLWNEAYELPFVFAVWVAREKLEDEIINTFEQILALGLSHKKEALEEAVIPKSFTINPLRYLETSISYDFDEKKKEAMSLYLEKLSQLNS